MTASFVIAGIAIALVLFLRYALRGFAAGIRTAEEIIGRTETVDLASFRNLMDPLEDRYLRESLSWPAFVHVRYLRLCAARDYVRRVSRNAAILVRLGECAQASSDPRVCRAGAELVTTAVHTRIYAGLAIAQLWIASLLPWWQPSTHLVSAYGELRNLLDEVLRLQSPGLASRAVSGT